MKKKNKVSSALILLGASALTPFLQGASMVAADESENKPSNEANEGAVKANSSGFFSFFEDLFKFFFSSPKEKPVIYISPPENFISTIYDKDIERAAKETLKREMKKEKEKEKEKNKNKKEVEVSDNEVNKRFDETITEEERIKRKVKEVIQKNYYWLIASGMIFSSEIGARVEDNKFSLKQRKKKLENGLYTLTSQLEELKKKVPNFEDIPVKVSKKQQLSEDEKKLIEKQNEVYTAKEKLRDVNECLDSIQNGVYRTSIKEDVYKDTFSKAFDISRREGNNKAILNRQDYFKEVVGFSESYFRENIDKFRDYFKNDNEGNVIFRNPLNGREFCAGKFEQISLGTAKEQSFSKKSAEKKGSISIIGINTSFGKASQDLKNKVDVSYLQAQKENRDALFVAASNFNCVELLSAKDDVEKKRITDYFYDSTQGPAEALPGLLATIVRHFFINKEKFPGDSSKWGQRASGDQQVNLLEGLGIKTKNGYILDNIGNILEITKKLEKGDEELKNKFKIGYHGNVQITADKVDFCKRTASFMYDKNQKVNQAYVAAVSLTDHDIKAILNKGGQEGYYEKKFGYCKGVLTDFAKQITKLNYESIFKTAAAKGIHKVYLPLLGCGAFKNDYHWVIGAINENKKFIEDNGLEVILNVSSAGTNEENPDFYKEVAQLTFGSDNKLNGKFEIYNEKYGKVVNVGEKILKRLEQGPQNSSESFFSKILRFFTF